MDRDLVTLLVMLAVASFGCGLAVANSWALLAVVETAIAAYAVARLLRVARRATVTLGPGTTVLGGPLHVAGRVDLRGSDG